MYEKDSITKPSSDVSRGRREMPPTTVFDESRRWCFNVRGFIKEITYALEKYSKQEKQRIMVLWRSNSHDIYAFSRYMLSQHHPTHARR